MDIYTDRRVGASTDTGATVFASRAAQRHFAGLRRAVASKTLSSEAASHRWYDLNEMAAMNERLVVSSGQQAADLAGEVDGGVDLEFAVGQALDVDPERQAEAAAVINHGSGVEQALLVRDGEGVTAGDRGA